MNKLWRSRKYLDSFRGMACVECQAEDGTVVAAHRNEGKGMGMKVADFLTIPLCALCHFLYDQGTTWSRPEKRAFFDRLFPVHLSNLLNSGKLNHDLHDRWLHEAGI